METLYDELQLQQDEIRLLQLHSAEQFSSEIRCQLSKAILWHPPSCEALLHFWGGSQITYSDIRHYNGNLIGLR